MRSYAVRQLNPFRGVLQVVETASARAFSDNGILWQLQVLADRPEHTWRSADRQTHREFFNWALWSEAKGPHRINANPLMDIGAMQAAADELLEVLRGQLPRLPFPLADRFEYWLCDKRGKPVVLIASTVEPKHATGTPDTEWHATTLEEQFESAALSSAGVSNQDGRPTRAHAQHLENEVRRRVQDGCWFERHENGNGHRIGEAQPNTLHFPSLGIATDWDEPLTGQLVQDYLDWHAPLLLLLPLPAEQRRSLEPLACQRAVEVAERYRLYPQIIREDLIEQARVEARIRRA